MASLIKLLNQYPKPKGKVFSYGTAGFREKAEVLDSVFVRMGILAWMRAVHVDQAIGLMVTASHNPVEDNGVKMIDPDGGMLDPAWEVHAADLANTNTAEEALNVIIKIAQSLNIRYEHTKEEFRIPRVSESSQVFLARDTRPHSFKLSKLAISGAECIGAFCVNYDVLTTPQLHFIVQHANYEDEERKFASENGYYDKVAQAYRQLVDNKRSSQGIDLIIDAGFGVGGLKFKTLVDAINKKGQLLSVAIRNVASEQEMHTPAVSQKLNNNVGAEHVQKMRALPDNTFLGSKEFNQKFASFDGDADRIVYFYVNEENKMILIDGDKIASLLAGFVKRQLSLLPQALQKEFTVGAVQTAYANGASMDYLHNRMELETPLVATGVKHCHHRAQDFDVGVYFEANGHGTVLFKPSMIARLSEVEKELKGDAKTAVKRLLSLSRLINQAAGDAMSDALAIEAILNIEKMSIQDFAALYDDLPSRQLKVKVKDRTVIRTVPDESKTINPPNLQPAIDTVVKGYTKGRAFARPSGTEDVVRVYAEAQTQELADELALKVCQTVYDFAGGIGPRP